MQTRRLISSTAENTSTPISARRQNIATARFTVKHVLIPNTHTRVVRRFSLRRGGAPWEEIKRKQRRPTSLMAELTFNVNLPSDWNRQPSVLEKKKTAEGRFPLEA